MKYRYAITIGGCYATFETEQEAQERLEWLERVTGRKGTIRKILIAG